MQVSTKVVDDYTLDVMTDQPAPILPTMMGTGDHRLAQHPDGRTHGDPIGTGPYKFTAWNVGENIILDRADSYWGEQPQVE